MSVDWFVNRDCAAKRDLTAQGILEGEKFRATADEVIEKARRHDPDTPLEQIVIKHTLWTPEGEELRDISAAEMLELAGELDPYRPACEDCQANVAAEPFGCLGCINYPFSAAGERWLMGQLPASLKSAAGFLLQQAKMDFGWTGATFAELRRTSHRFFELRRAPSRSWGGLFSRSIITADQLYSAMFEVGDIKPVHGAMLCFFVGALAEENMAPFLAAQDLSLLPDFRFEPRAEREATTSQLQMFFRALYIAALLEVTVTTDF